MRGTMPGAVVPTGLGQLLPGVLQEDDLLMRWCDGFDEVLAPVFATLDCLDAYLDPALSPSDFLDWIGTWVGLALDENWPLARRRLTVARAMELFRMRGTVTGLVQFVETLTGGTATVADSGGVAVSRTPGGGLPGEPVPRLAVRVEVDDPSTIDAAALDRVVAAAKPAHVVHRVEVVAR